MCDPSGQWKCVGRGFKGTKSYLYCWQLPSLDCVIIGMC